MDPKQEQKLKESFQALYHSEPWKSFAVLVDELHKHWRSQAVKFKAGATIEQIAVERIRLAAMCEGLEILFKEFNRIRGEEDGRKEG